MFELFDAIACGDYVCAVNFSRKKDVYRFLNCLLSYAEQKGRSTYRIVRFKEHTSMFWGKYSHNLCFIIECTRGEQLYIGWDHVDYFRKKGIEVISYKDLIREKDEMEDLSWILEHI